MNSCNRDAHSASQQVNNHHQRHRNISNSSALISVYLPSSAVKKREFIHRPGQWIDADLGARIK
ncbi:hypothetical protein QUB11_14235 [Microcoleus sp. B6-A1]|uniref:hypothetical protein n=1 Tax=Microcoleus sp. B6-A1 TaxID=2818684 RepID=UPI002FD652B9